MVTAILIDLLSNHFSLMNLKSDYFRLIWNLNFTLFGAVLNSITWSANIYILTVFRTDKKVVFLGVIKDSMLIELSLNGLAKTLLIAIWNDF